MQQSILVDRLSRPFSRIVDLPFTFPSSVMSVKRMLILRTLGLANTARESSLGEKVAANILPDSMNSLAQPCSNSGGARKLVVGIVVSTADLF